MIKISVHHCIDGYKPIDVLLPCVPRIGETFEMEKGNFYDVAEVIYTPMDGGQCGIWVRLKEQAE
jgi:hypothetical protein